MLIFPIVSNAQEIQTVQYRDSIFINRTLNTIVELSDGGPIIHMADLTANATNDISKIKNKMVFFSREGSDENKRYFKFKAIRPFNESVVLTIIGDSAAQYIIKYSEQQAKPYYKIKLPTYQIEEDIEFNNIKTRYKDIKYSTKQFVKYQNSKLNISKISKWNNSIFTSINKAYKVDNTIFLQVRIANHSLKTFEPDDIEIYAVDMTGEQIDLSYKIIDNFIVTIPHTSSITGTIILQEKNILEYNHLIIKIKEQNLSRNSELLLPITGIQNLNIK